jgi:hypothetical protein
MNGPILWGPVEQLQDVGHDKPINRPMSGGMKGLARMYRQPFFVGYAAVALVVVILTKLI